MTGQKCAAQNTDIGSDEIRAALEKIVNSPEFNRSRQLSSFLRYIVEQTLSGNGTRLKAYTIATEALGKPTDFDPQIDAAVRVHAARLRAALSSYFDRAGKDDDVVFDLPVGSYAPTFRRRSPDQTSSVSRISWTPSRRTAALIVALLILLGISMLINVRLAMQKSDLAPPSETTSAGVGLKEGPRREPAGTTGAGRNAGNANSQERAGSPSVHATLTASRKRSRYDL